VSAAISFVEFGGSLYGLSDTTHATWTAAEAEAISFGGHLVSITSTAEQDFIEATFLPGSSTEVYWIGATDATLEGTYVWSSGEPVSFTNWAPSEPDDFGSGADYSIINWQFGRGFGALGDWTDVADTGPRWTPKSGHGWTAESRP
jgi:hypothetical protein